MLTKESLTSGIERVSSTIIKAGSFRYRQASQSLNKLDKEILLLMEEDPKELAEHLDSIEQSKGLFDQDYYEPEQSILPDIHTPRRSVSLKAVDISVTNTSIREKTLSKVVEYTVSGHDPSGPFEILRRYKDFLTLRLTLLKLWPGCFVPQIPPKKMTGKFQASFIEHRRKLLELFLKKISLQPHLFGSEVFQAFLRGPPEFHKAFSGSRRPAAISLAQSFQTEFVDFVLHQPSESEVQSLHESLDYFQSALQTLEGFELVCQANVQFFASYEKDLSVLMQGVNDVSTFYSQHYGHRAVAVPVREFFHNPYSVLLDWTKAEILDLRAMIECIHAKYDWTKLLAKAQERLEGEKEGLQKLQGGKRGLLQKLSGKSAETQAKHAESSVESMEREVKALEDVDRIITARLVMFEAPRFKKDKAEKYELVMRTFAEMTVEEFGQLAAQVQKIEDSLSS